MASGKPIQEIPDKHSAISQFACQVFFYLDFFEALYFESKPLLIFPDDGLVEVHGSRQGHGVDVLVQPVHALHLGFSIDNG